MNKRKTAYVLAGGLLVTGLVFNAPTMATYVQKFNATQTINSATWNVEFGKNLGTHTIFPGDTVAEDKITLKNNNNYKVMYTINLKETGSSDTDFKLQNKLTLDLIKDNKSTGIKLSDNSIRFLVNPNETVELISKVTWTASEEENEDIRYQGQSVTYNYDVEVKSMGNSMKEEYPQQGVEVITVSSEEAIEILVEDIIKENPEAVIEDIKEIEGYFEYTIRVPKQSETFDYTTDKYDYIVVKVPKTLNDGKGLGNIKRTIFKITSAYRASKDQKIHVHFKLNESVDLSLASGDDVIIEYLNENGKSVSFKSKLYDKYLNSNGSKFPRKSEKVYVLEPGVYSTTANSNDNIKAIKVKIKKANSTYEETWNL